MSDSIFELKGMPYVPGVVRGVIKRQFDTIEPRSIIIISQNEIASLTELPAGFIVVDGAPLSHDLIALLSTGIPTVIIDQQQITPLQNGTEVSLDGISGIITNDPEAPLSPYRISSSISPGQAITTTDGTQVCLRASLRGIESARKTMAVGVESIGLVRSEYFMPVDGSLPDRNFYYRVFGELCETVKPLAVTIRLLDLAPDKLPAGILPDQVVGSALGLQGARLYTTEPIRSMLDAQLAAVNDLSQRYNIRLLIPYLVSREELDHWYRYIRKSLAQSIPVGAMVETPAAALDYRHWLDIADFIAIGTNDLMQCLFAADRDRPDLRQYLDPYAPLLYRFLQSMAPIENQQPANIQICGVLSQLSGVLPILLGLGYRAFTVDPALVPYLAHTIQSTRLGDAEQLAEQVCLARETQEVLDLLAL